MRVTRIFGLILSLGLASFGSSQAVVETRVFDIGSFPERKVQSVGLPSGDAVTFGNVGNSVAWVFRIWRTSPLGEVWSRNYSTESVENLEENFTHVVVGGPNWLYVLGMGNGTLTIGQVSQADGSNGWISRAAYVGEGGYINTGFMGADGSLVVVVDYYETALHPPRSFFYRIDPMSGAVLNVREFRAKVVQAVGRNAGGVIVGYLNGAKRFELPSFVTSWTRDLSVTDGLSSVKPVIGQNGQVVLRVDENIEAEEVILRTRAERVNPGSGATIWSSSLGRTPADLIHQGEAVVAPLGELVWNIRAGTEFGTSQKLTYQSIVDGSLITSFPIEPDERESKVAFDSRRNPMVIFNRDPHHFDSGVRRYSQATGALLNQVTWSSWDSADRIDSVSPQRLIRNTSGPWLEYVDAITLAPIGTVDVAVPVPGAASALIKVENGVEVLAFNSGSVSGFFSKNLANLTELFGSWGDNGVGLVAVTADLGRVVVQKSNRAIAKYLPSTANSWWLNYDAAADATQIIPVGNDVWVVSNSFAGTRVARIAGNGAILWQEDLTGSRKAFVTPSGDLILRSRDSVALLNGTTGSQVYDRTRPDATVPRDVAFAAGKTYLLQTDRVVEIDSLGNEVAFRLLADVGLQSARRMTAVGTRLVIYQATRRITGRSAVAVLAGSNLARVWTTSLPTNSSEEEVAIANGTNLFLGQTLTSPPAQGGFRTNSIWRIHRLDMATGAVRWSTQWAPAVGLNRVTSGYINAAGNPVFAGTGAVIGGNGLLSQPYAITFQR
jgi:hypothetical protein